MLYVNDLGSHTSYGTFESLRLAHAFGALQKCAYRISSNQPEFPNSVATIHTVKQVWEAKRLTGAWYVVDEEGTLWTAWAWEGQYEPPTFIYQAGYRFVQES